MDEKGTCVNRIHLYRTLHKAPIKREGKEPFLIREEIRLQIERGRRIYWKKLEPPPKYNYYAGNYSIKKWFLKAEKSHLENHVRMRS